MSVGHQEHNGGKTKSINCSYNKVIRSWERFRLTSGMFINDFYLYLSLQFIIRRAEVYAGL